MQASLDKTLAKWQLYFKHTNHWQATDNEEDNESVESVDLLEGL